MDVNSQVAGKVAVLTIEAGVTMQFPPGGTLNIEPGSGTAPAQGALIAIGGPAEAQKIVFTSDRGPASVAGDWLGVAFGGAIDPRSTMQNTRVEFAGGSSLSGGNSCPFPGIVINDAAIRIFGPPATQFITRTEIRVERALRHRSRLARRPAARLPGEQHLHRGGLVQGDDAAHLQRRLPGGRTLPVSAALRPS